MRRTDIINLLIATRRLESYLEIGVDRVDVNFVHVRCPRKVCVDPSPRVTRGVDHLCTSDEFFRNNTEQFDLIFIDGLHEEAQVDRDITNGINVLKADGVLVIHDALPPDRWHQRPVAQFRPGETWTGTVWKSVLKAFSASPYYCYIVNTDWGCAVIDTREAARHEPMSLGATLDYDTDFKKLHAFLKTSSEFIHDVSCVEPSEKS